MKKSAYFNLNEIKYQLKEKKNVKELEVYKILHKIKQNKKKRSLVKMLHS